MNNKIDYNIIGQGTKECIFFYHGLGDKSTSFTKLIETLKSKYKLVYFDLPGHGKNKNKIFSIKDTILILNEIIDREKLVYNYSIGHSFGGLLSLLANKMHNIKKFIVIEPSISRADQNFFKFVMEPPAGIGYDKFKNMIELDHLYAPIYKKNVNSMNPKAFKRYVSDYNDFSNIYIKEILGHRDKIIYIYGEDSPGKELRIDLINKYDLKSYCLSKAQHWVHQDQFDKVVNILKTNLSTIPR